MGDYYYLENKPQPNTFKIVHRSGCLKLTILRRDRAFLGTFYTAAEALVNAQQKHRACRVCPLCCSKTA